MNWEIKLTIWWTREQKNRNKFLRVLLWNSAKDWENLVKYLLWIAEAGNEFPVSQINASTCDILCTGVKKSDMTTISFICFQAFCQAISISNRSQTGQGVPWWLQAGFVIWSRIFSSLYNASGIFILLTLSTIFLVSICFH